MNDVTGEAGRVRSSASTSYPCSTRWATTVRPSLPVEPVTATRRRGVVEGEGEVEVTPSSCPRLRPSEQKGMPPAQVSGRHTLSCGWFHPVRMVSPRSAVAARVAGGAGGDVQEPVARRRLPGDATLDLATLDEHLQGPHGDGRAVDVEEPPGCGAGVGEAEPVGAERREVSGHPLLDLVLHLAHVVGDGHDGTTRVAQPLRH